MICFLCCSVSCKTSGRSEETEMNANIVATLVLIVSVSAIALSAAMALAWVAWYRTRNSGWIDTIWSCSIGIVGAVAGIAAAHGSARAFVVAICAILWSGRLGIHIARRTMTLRDDPRYAALIDAWGRSAASRMFLFLQTQALFGIPLVLSISLAAMNPDRLWRVSDLAAVALILIAVGFEALADIQLNGFRKRNYGSSGICDTGLWRFSRHPNYFFEWVGWCAYPLFAISPDFAYGFITLVAPVTMYWLLVHVSGIPPLEDHMMRTRGDAFRRYQARTSKFFPLPPLSNNPPS
jgi:steroid 5-alpha reductase family enzyme